MKQEIQEEVTSKTNWVGTPIDKTRRTELLKTNPELQHIARHLVMPTTDVVEFMHKLYLKLLSTNQVLEKRTIGKMWWVTLTYFRARRINSELQMARRLNDGRHQFCITTKCIHIENIPESAWTAFDITYTTNQLIKLTSIDRELCRRAKPFKLSKVNYIKLWTQAYNEGCRDNNTSIAGVLRCVN